jgi:hypothetical protein
MATVNDFIIGQYYKIDEIRTQNIVEVPDQPGFTEEIGSRISFIPCNEDGSMISNPEQYRILDFQYLHWNEGYNNFTRFNNETVISGPFTGCWMASCRKGGSDIIVHIHTNPGTCPTKDAWNNFIRDRCFNISGFRPMPEDITFDYYPQICGVVTDILDFYSLIFQRKYSNVWLLREKRVMPNDSRLFHL